MSPSALEIARDLIRFRSVTPADEGALGYVADLLARSGFVCERLPFGGIENLYARFGTSAPCLAFAGHTDVVPPGDAARWRFDPFGAEVADGKLWGRGAADMKGGVAASLAAALRFVAGGSVQGSVAFLLTGDEEGPAIDGTVRLVEWARRGPSASTIACSVSRPASSGSATPSRTAAAVR
jgi:succinyl-diaminopimelate desuccinylase